MNAGTAIPRQRKHTNNRNNPPAQASHVYKVEHKHHTEGNAGPLLHGSMLLL